jgi:hypothetical protein
MKHLIRIIAGAGMVTAVPLQHHAATTYFFTL